MIFRNKINGNTVKANGYAEEFAFSHNSNYELVEIDKIKKENTEKTKKETKSKSTKENTEKTKKETTKVTDDKKPKTGDDVIKELLKDKVE